MNSIIKRPGFGDRYDRARRQHAIAFQDLGRDGQGIYLQSADLNEIQSRSADQTRRVADYILQDGRIVDGPDPVVEIIDDDTIRVRLPDCSIYIGGLVHDVPGATFELSNEGDFIIGVRSTEELVNDIEDAGLKGSIPGTEAFAEEGASRIEINVAWGHSLDGNLAPLISVYSVKDGAIITTETNTEYSEIYLAMANYSRESNGSFVNNGCIVSSVGRNADGDQVFAVSEGTAYVNGRRLPRAQSLRFAIAEQPDLRDVSGEPHPYEGATGGSQTFAVSKTPIESVQRILIVKETTEVVVHGAFSGATDPLQHSSVKEVIEVKSGSTTYLSPASWLLSQGAIDWSPTGPEPAPGASYTVKYRYYENVAADEVGRDFITVSGMATDTDVLFDYKYKLPRIDILAMAQDGALLYLRGTSAISRARPPSVPSNLLELAQITNNWGLTPGVKQTQVRNYPYERLTRMETMLLDIFDLVAQERLKTDITAKEVAAKRGMFVDAFNDDDMRDQGIAQTAACFGGKMRLPILARPHNLTIAAGLQHLDYTQEIIISQLRQSGSMKINPYAVYSPVPARASLSPATDMWEEKDSVWLSDTTKSFAASSGEYISGISLSEQVDLVRETVAEAKIIRQRELAFKIEGFIPGETLKNMWFDDEIVTPTGHSPADEAGIISGNFTIPPNIPTGSKVVYFEGSVGTVASCSYVARGTITTEEYRLATTLNTTTATMPVPVVNNTVVNNVTNVTNVTNVINQSSANSTVVRRGGDGGTSPGSGHSTGNDAP